MKFCEEGQLTDETELFINSQIDQNLTQTEFDVIDIQYQLERHIQNKESKDSGWRFDESSSMTIFFIKRKN